MNERASTRIRTVDRTAPAARRLTRWALALIVAFRRHCVRHRPEYAAKVPNEMQRNATAVTPKNAHFTPHDLRQSRRVAESSPPLWRVVMEGGR